MTGPDWLEELFTGPITPSAQSRQPPARDWETLLEGRMVCGLELVLVERLRLDGLALRLRLREQDWLEGVEVWSVRLDGVQGEVHLAANPGGGWDASIVWDAPAWLDDLIGGHGATPHEALLEVEAAVGRRVAALARVLNGLGRFDAEHVEDFGGQVETEAKEEIEALEERAAALEECGR